MLGPILHGDKLTLAPADYDDLAIFRAWLANPDVTRYLVVRFVPSADQEEAWFKRTAESSNDVYWVMKVNGRTVGSTAIHAINWVDRWAVTGTMIGETSEWGKGYGSEATRLRTAYAFDELGLERLETTSLAPNIGMHRALEKSGYRRIATLRRYRWGAGKWHDAYLFELLREEWQDRR